MRYYHGDAPGEHHRHRDPKRWPQHTLRRSEIRRKTFSHLRYEIRHSTMVFGHKLESARRLDVSGLVSQVAILFLQPVLILLVIHLSVF